MTIYVIYNVLMLNFSVRELVLQLKKIVNVTKDMYLYVVLIIELIEIHVWWNVLKLENNITVFVEIMKLIILKSLVNVNVVIKYNLFVVLITELILTLVSLTVLLVVKLFIGVNVNISIQNNVVVKIMKCLFVVEIWKHIKINVLWIVWKLIKRKKVLVKVLVCHKKVIKIIGLILSNKWMMISHIVVDNYSCFKEYFIYIFCAFFIFFYLIIFKIFY